MRWADIEVPNLPAAVDARGRSACYPRSTFYLLSDDPSTRDHRITRSWFPICSTYRSHSQASFCPYTLCAIANRAELTFELLRYFLGGDRPSQTAHLALSRALLQGVAVRHLTVQGWYFKGGSPSPGRDGSSPPTYPTHAQPEANTKLQ